MKNLFALIALLAPAFLFAQLNGNYLIDDGGGGDYVSMSTAVADLNTQGISGPVTFDFANGSGPYIEQVSISQGGTAAWPIIFEGNGATIEFAPNSIDRYIVRVDNAEYITFHELNIKATAGVNYAWGYHIFGEADHVTIDDCRIRIPGDNYNNNLVGINANGLTESTYTFGNPFGPDFLTIKNCLLINGNTGINVAGKTDAPADHCDGLLIEGNTFQNTFAFGVDIAGVTNFDIIKNTFEVRTASTSSISGIALLVGIADGSNLISRNRILGYDRYGMELYSVSGTETIVSNNFVGGESVILAGGSNIFISSCTNVKLWHNTLIKAAGYGAPLFIFGVSNVDVRNNIFVHQERNGWCLEIRNPDDLLALDNNAYYADNMARSWGGSSFLYTFADFLADPRGPAGRDASSVNILPNFRNNNDPHLAGFLMEGLGQPGLVADDIDGDLRSSSPDLGADEFTNPNFDASPFAVISPLNGSPGVYPVQVSVQNLGTIDMENVDAMVIIDDGISTTTLGPVTHIDAPAAYGDPLTIDLGTYNFTERNYTLTVVSSLPNNQNDTVTYNDTLMATIGFCFPFNGTYTINQTAPASNTNFTSIKSAVDEVSFCGIDGPVNLVISPGSGPYTEQFIIPDIPGSSASSQLTIRGRGETVGYAATESSFQYIAKFQGSSNVVLDGITFEDLGSTLETWLVMFTQDSHDITVRNCKLNQIYPVDNFPSSVANDYACIGIGEYVHTSAPSSGYNILIENNEFTGGYMSFHTYGLESTFFPYLDYGNGTHDISFLNNHFSKYEDHAVDARNSDNFIFNGNTLDRATQLFTDDDFQLWSSNGGEIINNTFYVRSFLGMRLNSLNLDSDDTRTLVANNMMSMFRDNLYGPECILLRSSNNIDLENNSFNGYGNGAIDVLTLDLDHDTTDINIRNNSFVTTSTLDGYAVQVDDGNAASVNWENNNFYAASGSLIYQSGAGVTATNLSELNAQLGGLGAMVQLPAHVSDTDLHLAAGSPLIDAGGTALVSHDFDGGLRPATTGGAVDLGADEFGSACTVPANPFSDNITTTMASLHWDPVPSASGYLLQGRKAPSGSPNTLQLAVTDVTYNVFEPGATYQWRVQALCPFQNSDFTSPQSFTMLTLREGAPSLASLTPNPAVDFSNLQIEVGIAQVAFVEIFDLQGKLMHSQSDALSEGTQQLRLDLSNLPAGVYEVITTLESGSKSDRLVIGK